MKVVLTILLLLASTAHTIWLTVVTEEGEIPINGLAVDFKDDLGNVLASCETDSNGRCELTIEIGETPIGLVTGSLNFGANGIRSVTWPEGEDLVLTLYTDQFGKILVPGHHEHPTPDVFMTEYDPDLATLPPAQEIEIEEILPTTEFVVIDGNLFTPEPEVTRLTTRDMITDVIVIPVQATETTVIVPPAAEAARPWPLIMGMIIVFITLIGGIVVFALREQKETKDV